jgi:hypothetical protein
MHSMHAKRRNPDGTKGAALRCHALRKARRRPHPPIGGIVSIQWHAWLVLHRAHGERRADVVHIGGGREVADDEILEGGEVRRDAFQHEVDIAGQHHAFAHDG